MQLYSLLLEWCRSFGAIIRSEGQESTEGCQGHCSMLLTPAEMDIRAYGIQGGRLIRWSA